MSVARVTQIRVFAVAGWLMMISACGDQESPIDPGPPGEAAVATRLAFDVSPGNGTAGAPLAPAVEVSFKDDEGNVVTSVTDAITLELVNDTANATLFGTFTVNAVDGVATFDDLVIEKSATGYTLGATSDGVTSGTSPAFDIAPGAPSELTFRTPPTNVDLELPFDPAIEVVVLDALGNVATDPVDITLTLAANPGQALLDGTTTIPSVNGVATFADLQVDRVAAGYTLTAASAGLPSITSTPFDVVLAFQQLSGSIDVQFIQDHTCGLTTAGAVYCWGANFLGQLGDGNNGTDQDTPIRVLGGHTFASIATGFAHTCGIETAGPAWCWGLNIAGQLGDGNPGNDTDIPVPVQGGHAFVSLVGGLGFTCGLTTEREALCWGVNDVGQLGDGNTGTDSPVPVAVLGGHRFASIAGGGQHTCGLTTEGGVYCWGDNGYGQLGDGKTGQDSDVPVPIQGAHTFASVAAGSYHTCGLTTDAEAYCWGFNTSGQLGDGNLDQDSDTPTAVQGGYRFASIVAGTLHTCGLTTGQEALCWGDNTTGELGDGTNGAERDVPGLVLGNQKFASLTAGSFHTCGVTIDRTAYCWGWNGWGQLGDGNVGEDQYTPTPVVNP